MGIDGKHFCVCLFSKGKFLQTNITVVVETFMRILCHLTAHRRSADINGPTGRGQSVTDKTCRVLTKHGGYQMKKSHHEIREQGLFLL